MNGLVILLRKLQKKKSKQIHLMFWIRFHSFFLIILQKEQVNRDFAGSNPACSLKYSQVAELVRRRGAVCFTSFLVKQYPKNTGSTPVKYRFDSCSDYNQFVISCLTLRER